MKKKTFLNQRLIDIAFMPKIRRAAALQQVVTSRFIKTVHETHHSCECVRVFRYVYLQAFQVSLLRVKEYLLPEPSLLCTIQIASARKREERLGFGDATRLAKPDAMLHSIPQICELTVQEYQLSLGNHT